MNLALKTLQLYALSLILSLGLHLAFGIHNWFPITTDTADTFQRLVGMADGIGSLSFILFGISVVVGVALDRLRNVPLFNSTDKAADKSVVS